MKNRKRPIVFILMLAMLITMMPTTAVFAAHDSSGRPTDMNGQVTLAIYNKGTNFPGEPSVHSIYDYTSFKPNFTTNTQSLWGGTPFASNASDVFKPEIVNALIQGTGNSYSKVWGVFDTVSLEQYFTDSLKEKLTEKGTDNLTGEEKIIKAIKGSNADTSKYEIVWYVIKYQTSDEWHLDGVIVEKTSDPTFHVNYYGNFATGGSAPDGVQNIASGASYTIAGQGNLKRTGYEFQGWNTNMDGTGTDYKAGQQINVTTNLALYAKWAIKNMYTATVNTYLDGNIKSANDIHGENIGLYLSTDGAVFTTLEAVSGATGKYTAQLEHNGTYYLYHKHIGESSFEKIGNHELVIYNNHGSLDVHHYSVSYDLNGGNGVSIPAENYYGGTQVYATDKVPTKGEQVFAGWKVNDGNIIQPGEEITSHLREKTVLVAQWEELAKVSVVIVTSSTSIRNRTDEDGQREARIILTHRSNSDGVFVEVNGSSTTRAVNISSSDSIKNDLGTIYTNLPANQQYGVNVIMDQYKVIAKEITRSATDTNHRIITVTMQYDPLGFNLKTNVVADESVNGGLIPKAVDIKILYWNGASWHPIDEHLASGTPESSIDVSINENTKTGSEEYHVWGFEENGITPYYYRVEVVGIDIDGTHTLSTTETAGVYKAGPYTATVVVSDGAIPTSGSLSGAYATKNGDGEAATATQTGTITIILSAQAYDVTFDANGGTVSGSATYVEKDIYKIPNLGDYTPTRDGGYVFAGWYLDSNPAVSGTWLDRDVTLIANWKEPLTVSGTVIIDGTYKHNDEIVTVNAIDRAEKVLVTLQKVVTVGLSDGDDDEHNGVHTHVYDVAAQEVVFGTSYEATTSAIYEFKNVANEDCQYQIHVYVLNYTTTYNNDADSTFSTDEAIAKFNGGTSAVVDAHLDFNPDSYPQAIVIDASNIAEGYRPTSVFTQILYRDQGDRHPYKPIAQHMGTSGGQVVDLSSDSGIGQTSEKIWKYHYNHSLYEYILNVTKIYGEVSGGAFLSGAAYNSATMPFSVIANTSYWDDNLATPGATTLTAILTPKAYTVTFDLNAGEDVVGGMDGYAIKVEDTLLGYQTSYVWSYGKEFSATPQRAGYTFNGWTVSGSSIAGVDISGASVSISPDVFENIVLTANWTQDSYVITYTDGVDGEEVFTDVTKSAVYGTSTPAIDNPTRAGYTFAGWSPAIADTVTTNAAYTAQWTQDKYIVTYVDGENTLQSTGDLTYGVSTPAIDSPTKAGYTFVGWSPEWSATVTGNVTYTAVWSINKYTVKYMNGENVIQTIENVTHGAATPTCSAIPTKEGYTLTGWSPAIADTVTTNAAYTAQWTANSYVITYKDGESIISTHSAVYGTSTPAIDNPTKAGYTFNGWSPEIAATVTTNAAYTAQWTINNYTVTYTDGIDGVESVLYTTTVAYGTSIPTIANPTRTGYTFANWNATPEGIVTGNVTFTAVWNINQYTIAFESNGGSPVESITQNYDTAVTAPTAPTKAGYTFGDWYADAGLTSEYTFTKMPAENITLYALWTANNYTITYTDGVDGEEVFADQTTTVAYGTSMPAFVGTPTREGHTFVGWNTTPAATVTGDATYTAQWEINTYTVTFKPENGGADIVNTVTYGAVIEKPANPEKAGHTFAGWDSAVAATMPAMNLTYTAQWTPNQYTIIYVDGFGETLETTTAAYGTSTPAIDNPTKAGYTFNGWSPEIAATVTTNAAYTAQWTINNYTVTYTDGIDGVGSVLYTTTVAYGTSMPTIDNPTRAGYTFANWNSTPEGTVTGNVTYTAVWSINSYVITYHNGESIISTHSAVYGDATPTIANPEKIGHTFSGWTPSVVLTVTESVTYTAVWDAANVEYTIEHKLQNIAGNAYETVETATKAGFTGTSTEAIANSYEGFIVQPIVQQTIAADGSTIVEIKYNRNSYIITYKDGIAGDGEVISTHSAVYGADTPTIASPTRGGYTFNGWTPTVAATVSAVQTYVAQWTPVPTPPSPGITPKPDPVTTTAVTGSAVLIKVDAVDKSTGLANVVFNLYDSSKNVLLGSYKTDADGKIKVDSLTAGAYYFMETRPTEGYKIDKSKHEFTVTAGTNTSITVENSRTPVPIVFTGDHYGYVVGYEDGSVLPEAKITRAEVATIFFRLLTDEVRSTNLTTSNNFSDVKEKSWYNTAVSTMAKMGIINGRPDGTFGPNDYITRAEFAAIAARFEENGDTSDASFTDIYKHWAKREINIVANNGWILGYEGGEFRPNQQITRAEAMALVNRVLQRIPGGVEDLLPGMITYPDNQDVSKWYYLTIQEAANSHYYKHRENGYEYWTELRAPKDWSTLQK